MTSESLKTFRQLTEALGDLHSHSNRRLRSIISNPRHPLHSAAKAEMDRRSMQQEKTLTPAEQIDEISNKMKDRYIRKSSSDHQHANAVRKDAESRGDKDLASKMKDIMKKRNQGMTRAFGVAEAKDGELWKWYKKNYTNKKNKPTDTQMGTITVTTDAQRKARAQAYRDKKAKEAMKKEEVEPVAEKSKGLWANIHAKRKRGEKPNPPGHPDRPTKADFERSQK